MIVNDVIQRARIQYGEKTENVVTETDSLNYFDMAFKEIVEDLPAERLQGLLSQTPLVPNNGLVELPEDAHRLVEVYVDDYPARVVTLDQIRYSNELTFFGSPVPIFSIDGRHIFYSPEDISSLEIVYVETPPELTMQQEITQLDSIFLGPLVDLITSYMYAAEEDIQQADIYRNSYLQKLRSATHAVEQEQGATA